MKVTYNWLKDFVDIKVEPEELARRLTMSGSEVTSLEAKGDDFVFEIEITSNRPDCLSIIGIAREVAAITNVTLKAPNAKPKPKAKKASGDFAIKIEAKKDCSLYTARIIKGVKVGPSPAWLTKRLELVGCRCVNNIVDITNYVLFELGEPLHAFDLDALGGNTIIVRRSRQGEKLVSIDAEARTLSPEILVIADQEKPVAIAGVMGGKDTEVSGNTRNILLEAAVFDPLVVRRSRQKLGIQSEAAYRFERGIDPGIVEVASTRAAELIRGVCGGDFVLTKSAGLAKTIQRKVSVGVKRINKNLGVNISPAKIKQILSGLGFKVGAQTKKVFSVGIPSFRQDVKAEIDLIEEIARVFGYENIPTTLPKVTLQTKTKDINDLISLVKKILVGLGLNEAITYSLIDRDWLKGFWDRENCLIEILNPLSKEQEILRPLLMASLCRCVAYNLRQKQPQVNIFEIAKTYVKSEQEKYVLGVALCGTKSWWFGPQQGHLQEEAGFLHLKGILQELFLRLGILEKEYRFAGSLDEFTVYLNNNKIGVLKRLGREILEQLEIKNKEVFALEIGLDGISSCTRLKKEVRLPQKYPGIIRDITLELKEDISVEQILSKAAQLGGDLLSEVKFKAYYDKNVPAGFKRITISCQYCSKERTLTEAEINPLQEILIRGLKEEFQA
jgi:phenylalanyl-tRNA synthetase beta chain